MTAPAGAAGQWLGAAATAAALAASLLLAVGPAYEPSGDTLIEREGAWVVGLLAVPVAVVALGWIARWRGHRHAALGAAMLLGAFVILGAASIGLFFAPALVLLVLAVTLQQP